MGDSRGRGSSANGVCTQWSSRTYYRLVETAEGSGGVAEGGRTIRMTVPSHGSGRGRGRGREWRVWSKKGHTVSLETAEGGGGGCVVDNWPHRLIGDGRGRERGRQWGV